MERMELAKLNGQYDNDISIRKLIERDGNKCYLCNNETTFEVNHTHNKYPTIEHVIPIAKGGTHSWDNVKVACRECNINKGVLSVEEFKNKDITEEVYKEEVVSKPFIEGDLMSLREVAEMFNEMTDKAIEKGTVAYYCEKLDIEFVRDSYNRKYLTQDDIQKIRERYYNNVSNSDISTEDNKEDIVYLKEYINTLKDQLVSKDRQIESLISIVDKLS